MKREQRLISVTVRSVRRLSRLLLIFVSSLSAVAWRQGSQKLQPSNGFQIFSRDLDGDRNLLRIPGMAAASLKMAESSGEEILAFPTWKANFPSLLLRSSLSRL